MLFSPTAVWKRREAQAPEHLRQQPSSLAIPYFEMKSMADQAGLQNSS